jgi:IS5 family transposase
MTEYMINDRLSFQRFLGLTLGSKVPDAKTIWLFRDTLSKKGMDRQLFDFFNRVMEREGIITRTGSIVDASFVEVPRQRNTREENKTIKAGEIPEEWRRDTPEDRNKLSQKDTDARWAKKNEELHYGYKDHIKIDKDSKIIIEYTVTAASVHDSRAILVLVDEQDEVIYADSAYVGEELHEEIREVACNARLEIHEKGQRNNPLNEKQKASNTVKSRIRARVEHIFGFMENSMGGLFSRLIGITRNSFIIGIKNLAYNLSRYAFLVGNKRIFA